MGKLCDFGNLPNARKEVADRIRTIRTYKKETDCGWLISYYEMLEEKLGQGKLQADTEDENIYKILNAIVKLDTDMWVRNFSAKTINNSKQFKRKYVKKIVDILRKYADLEDMESVSDEKILNYYHLYEYSQTMEWKGGMIVMVDDVIIPPIPYGNIINTQTLEKANPKDLGKIKRVITIENKATYESMEYREDTLCLYIHGFPSPKESIFLSKLREIASEEVIFYHWSDLDYGGIRIYEYVKKNLFPGLRPYRMDKSTYLKAIEDGCGIPLDERKKERLKKIETEDLKELKECILEHEIEIEQEML